MTVFRLSPKHNWTIPFAGAIFLLLVAGSGCALLESTSWNAVGMTEPRQEVLLKPIDSTRPQAIRVEYQIIERPVEDPLLGQLLWDELVEMGLFDHDVRRALNEQGFRVGVANNQPPAALEKLRGSLAEIIDPSLPESTNRRSSRVLTLPDGDPVDFQTGNVIDEYTTSLEVNGERKEHAFQKARGVIVVTAASQQPGWAEISFVPEIRHGDFQSRPIVSDSGWKGLETSQNIHRLVKQRFSMKLIEGDSVIITSMGQADDRVGDLFFRDIVDGVPVQRILVVRLLKVDAELAAKN